MSEEEKITEVTPDPKTKRPILIVDAYSLFIRQYQAHPDMSEDGEQVGGLVGTLKALKNLIYEFNPTRVYFVWESGGSTRRKKIFPDYKKGRIPPRLNRFYGEDIPDTTENKFKQISYLYEAIKCLPVCQMYVKDCEADDVISWLLRYYQTEKIIIVSTDKDYYQLLNERISVYTPAKKKIINFEDVYKEFFIHPKNFAVAKAICGDVSDNIPGIKGCGYKNLIKRFPQFTLDKEIEIDEVIEYATPRRQDLKIYNDVFSGKDTIKRNFHLVYLGSPQLSAAQIEKIEYARDNFEPKTNVFPFVEIIKKAKVKTLDKFDYTTYFRGLKTNVRTE